MNQYSWFGTTFRALVVLALALALTLLKLGKLAYPLLYLASSEGTSSIANY
tara:strand:+ start:146 stop:298 length:153 start_codon:yes stop_codon:yes gene_type:complete